MFHKKIETFSEDVIRTLLTSASFTSHVVSAIEVLRFVWHIVVFCQCGFLTVLNCSKICHARRLGHFTREITLFDEYLSQFLPDCKVLWITLKQLLEIFVKLTILDCNRATYVSPEGQNRFIIPSEWGNALKTSKISQESILRSHRIDQKRRQKILESYIKTVPRIFLDIKFSRRISVSWYVIWRVNPSGPALIWITFCPGSHFIHDQWTGHIKAKLMFRFLTFFKKFNHVWLQSTLPAILDFVSHLEIFLYNMT